MTSKSMRMVWTGRAMSVLPALMFLFSAAMKFVGGEQVEQGFQHLGLPASMRLPLGVLELACVVVYLIPRTALLGAILLAGYIGGAIVTHWRLGEPVFIQILLGLVVWLGVWLREPRLRELIPLRIPAADGGRL